MPYPSSTPVSSGQPTFAAHYNNLRLDALSFGQAEADVVPLGTFFKRFAQGITLTYLPVNRLRIPYNTANPPTLMINSCMLQAAANVDLPAGLFSGVAATWYIFAVRTPGSTTFTLSVNTSPIETTDQRLIGSVDWTGLKLTNLINLSPSSVPGQVSIDSVDMSTFFKRFASGIHLVYLATNRIRLLYDPLYPPSIVIDNYLLQNTAVVDLASSQFSGGAATWYIFAVRTAGSSTFTLAVSTSSAESTDQRLIGQCTWDGTKVTFVYTTVYSDHQLAEPDYDSGWFAVAAAQQYTKAHSLLQWPRLVILLHSPVATGADEWQPVTVVQNGLNIEKSVLGWSSINVYCDSGVDPASSATCWSTRRASNVGYWRVLAWK